MQALLALGAFIETPLGQAIVAAIPTLVGDIVKIWHQNGTVSTQEIATYLASQAAFDTLVPKKVTP